MVGLALLTLVPFFNFHALKFNQNTVLLPLWAATTLFFLRSFESRRMLDGALAGVFAALSIYGKYWSVMLLVGLGIAALTDRAAQGVFPVARAVGDDRGRCAGAGPARGLAHRQRLRAVLVCARHSFGAVVRGGSAEPADLSGRRCSLRGAAGDPGDRRDAAHHAAASGHPVA